MSFGQAQQRQPAQQQQRPQYAPGTQFLRGGQTLSGEQFGGLPDWAKQRALASNLRMKYAPPTEKAAPGEASRAYLSDRFSGVGDDGGNYGRTAYRDLQQSVGDKNAFYDQNYNAAINAAKTGGAMPTYLSPADRAAQQQALKKPMSSMDWLTQNMGGG